MESASTRFARSLAPQNVRPAPECRPVCHAAEAEPAEKRKFGETNPAGISPRGLVLPGRDGSQLTLEHSRPPAYRRRCVPLLLLPAPATAWPACAGACRRFHPRKLSRDRLAQTFRCAVPQRL